MTISSDILSARARMFQENRTPTRLEITKATAKALAKECGIDFPDDWNPAEGEHIGLIYGIPMYINNTLHSFAMLGAYQL